VSQSSPVVSAARNNRALDEAIHAIPLALFRPAPAVYWVDMLASAGLGWTSLVFAVVADRWSRAALLLIAVAALYRAVLFIHEITHRAGRDLTAFAFVWNALVGVPLLVPSFLYEGVHTDHHRQSCYGTEADPEYLPSATIGLTLASLLAPLALVVRFGVLVPLCWALPAVRRLTAERWSALVINPRYLRRAPIGRAGRAEEAAACVVLWLSVGLWWSGRIPASALLVLGRCQRCRVGEQRDPHTYGAPLRPRLG
jgi:fatty acid desaturase